MEKFRLLKAEEIEVKIKQVTSKGAIALIYKTSRVDMDILDETVGAENWETDYKEIKGNLYCGVGVRAEAGKPIVWKWDCGIESRSDDEGNEKKGEASDAFKRACVKWGIGRELYSAPFIFIKRETVADGKKYKLVNPFEKFEVSEIQYDENRRIIAITIVNENGELAFQYPSKKASVSSENKKKGNSSDGKKIEQQEADDGTWRLSKAELVTAYEVESAEKAILYYEKALGGKPFAEWTKEETEVVREDLEKKLEKRKAQKKLKAIDGDLPFTEV
ncbi:MAG: hypothetical protein IIX01_01785 [Clostridia bacterium]|nr:hypothetical protein [Clostridia bacterium]